MLMRTNYLSVLVSPWWLVISTSAHADTYDYEVGISYDAGRMSSEFNSPVTGPIIPVIPVTLESELDTDDVTVFGTWYFDGVSAPAGPRSRAAFLGRASAVTLRYTRGSGDTTTTLTSFGPVPGPPSVFNGDQSSDTFSASLRYVWPESGWYGLASALTTDSEFDSGFGSIDTGADTFSLGVGKYIGSQTSLDLRVLHVESDSPAFVIVGDLTSGTDLTSTEAAIAFSHIGALGNTWQYAADILLATTEVGGSDGSFDSRLSLYPSRAFAFGIDVEGGLQDFSDGPTTYELFASWFPSERIELTANYSTVDVDEPRNFDFDQDNFGAGVNFRF